ncbi:hypothetical protein K435DRAFT_820893 [Dendrothele bispora CBS 962.96]|uniref:Carbohydrate esterase family 16 protein n=1 Tax=Dendrothele bispora (strain CBS 962.96) TaxID=1314807 RepID=A0A4S8LPU2_DENBC|nr:hypothetical protein K435DRAFT_820893 [Dendrothele bispora CBS 962.96]
MSSMKPLLLLLSTCTLLQRVFSQTPTTPVFPALVNSSLPLTLAIEPACGSLYSENFTEVNTGIIPLSSALTIVAFGDSWTSNGANGSIPIPPMLWPPSPSAGSLITPGRRASNGFIWIESLANTFVIDNFAWNTTSPNNATVNSFIFISLVDFVSEAKLFFLQGKILDSLNPSHTLYTVAFGIKSMYKSHPNTDILQNRVFSYLRDSKTVNGTNFAFVNLERLFTAIANDPEPFGYKGNATCLISANTIVGGCDDPDHSVFWIPGHPSQNTHELMNLYTQAVLDECQV